MRGTILAYMTEKGIGLIGAAGGRRLLFRAEHWQDAIAPEIGMRVEFAADDNFHATAVYLAAPDYLDTRPCARPSVAANAPLLAPPSQRSIRGRTRAGLLYMGVLLSALALVWLN